MNILKIKNRFGFLRRHLAYRAIKKDLEQYSYTEYTIPFLKIFKKKMLFVGNIRNVKQVFLIPYNTKKGHYWFKQLYYPFNFIKEMRKNIMARFVPVLIVYFLLMMAVVALLFLNIIPFKFYNAVLSLVMICVLPMAFFGIGSRNNVASGDAQIRFAMDVLNKNDPLLKNRVGFIFCDTFDRATLMTNIQKFFNEHNKKPLLVELPFLSYDGELFVCGTKNESKLIHQFAKKNKLTASFFPLFPEYYGYSKYMMLSYGEKDKDNDVYLKYTFKNREKFNEKQYQRLMDIVLKDIYE